MKQLSVSLLIGCLILSATCAEAGSIQSERPASSVSSQTSLPLDTPAALPEIGKLTSLAELWLDGNNLSSLPLELCTVFMGKVFPAAMCAP
jgi:hypothetical protein